MKKAINLLFSFSLLLLFMAGCSKKKKHLEQTQVHALVDRNALITPSPYVHRHVEKAEHHDATAELSAPERVATTQELFQEIEARFDDLFIPLGFVPVVCHRYENGFFLEGTTNLSPADCLHLCQQAMERFGWERGLAITAEPVLVVYTKPGHSCAYRFTPGKTSWFSKNNGSLLEVWFSVIA